MLSEKIKVALVEIVPYMEEAKEGSILKAIKDSSCTALMPPDSKPRREIRGNDA